MSLIVHVICVGVPSVTVPDEKVLGLLVTLALNRPKVKLAMSVVTAPSVVAVAPTSATRLLVDGCISFFPRLS